MTSSTTELLASRPGYRSDLAGVQSAAKGLSSSALCCVGGRKTAVASKRGLTRNDAAYASTKPHTMEPRRNGQRRMTDCATGSRSLGGAGDSSHTGAAFAIASGGSGLGFMASVQVLTAYLSSKMGDRCHLARIAIVAAPSPNCPTIVATSRTRCTSDRLSITGGTTIVSPGKINARSTFAYCLLTTEPSARSTNVRLRSA